MNYQPAISRPKGWIHRKPDPIMFCHYCRAPLIRKRYADGRIDKMRDFQKRKFCDQECYRLSRWR